MRVKSPEVSPVTAADRQAVVDALAATGAKAATFEAIRAKLPGGARGRFTDGYLHQAALDAGLIVEPD